MSDGHVLSIWQGPRVRLRGIEPADWETFYAWDQDTEQARALDVIPFPQSRAATQAWVEQESQKRSDDDTCRLAITNTAGEIVGSISTHNCDRRVGAFSYGVSILAAERGQGYAAEAIALLLRYYFQELRYQKVTVHVFAFNTPSIRLHEKLGFQLEGRLRRMVYSNGQYYDELIYGLTAEEFSADPISRVMG